MRELLFRAFDKDRGNMEYIDDLYWFEEEGVRDSSGDGHFANYVLMQYTGLKDRNGKEIYEGDILPYRNVVSWVDGSDPANLGMEVGFYAQRDNFESWRLLEVGEELEVLGNIYENPELLGQ
jgi:hypothetical protein